MARVGESQRRAVYMPGENGSLLMNTSPAAHKAIFLVIDREENGSPFSSWEGLPVMEKGTQLLDESTRKGIGE